MKTVPTDCAPFGVLSPGERAELVQLRHRVLQLEAAAERMAVEETVVAAAISVVELAYAELGEAGAL